MSVKRLSKREKKMFFWAVAVIGCIGLYTLVIDPIVNRWLNINEMISVKNKKLIKNYRIIAQKNRITSLYEEYAKDIRAQKTKEEETATILKEVEVLARQNRVHINDIKPRSVKDGGFYKEYVIELESEGSMSDLANFMYMLQTSEQVLKVKYLRLTAKAGEADTLKAFMTISKVLVI